MLYLSRKVGESIIINNNVEVMVVEVRGRGGVKLGLSFPPDVSVLRKEVHDRITAENRAAARGGVQDLPGEWWENGVEISLNNPQGEGKND